MWLLSNARSRRSYTRSAMMQAHRRAIRDIVSGGAYDEPPKRIILDLDATTIPCTGDQEGRFFHGYYDCYCYLPLYIFCGRHLLAAKLQPTANIDASAGADRGGCTPGSADPRRAGAKWRSAFVPIAVLRARN